MPPNRLPHRLSRRLSHLRPHRRGHRRGHPPSWTAVALAVVAMLAAGSAAAVHLLTAAGGGVDAVARGGPAAGVGAPATGGPSRAVATAPATPAVRVAALTRRVTPTVLVTAAHGALTPAAVTTSVGLAQARATLLVALGRVRLGRGATTALGVDPSSFRAFTPAGTAESTALWTSVAAGNVAVARSVAAALGVPLGGPTQVDGVTLRVGAYAETGLPGIGLVVDQNRDAALGLVPGSALLITSAPGMDPVVAAAEINQALGPSAHAVSLSVPTVGGHLEWVAPVIGPITSAYGPRINPITHQGTDFEYGIDIGAPFGAPIYAAASGYVVYAGPAAGFGQEIILSHPGDVETTYGHMERILVYSGPVTVGQVIALVGSEGDSTGPHLDFQVLVHGVRVNPLTWLEEHGVRVGS